MMAQRFGQGRVEAYAVAHEGGGQNPANREAMDLYNNEVGRAIGATHQNASPNELAELVGKALQQGELVVVDQRGRLQWSDRVPVGQHGLVPPEFLPPRIQTPHTVSPEDRTHEVSPAPPRDPTQGENHNPPPMSAAPITGTTVPLYASIRSRTPADVSDAKAAEATSPRCRTASITRTSWAPSPCNTIVSISAA